MFVAVYYSHLPAKKPIWAIQTDCKLLFPGGGDCTGNAPIHLKQIVTKFISKS